eukprot:804971-Amphidinium_carterae.1
MQAVVAFSVAPSECKGLSVQPSSQPNSCSLQPLVNSLDANNHHSQIALCIESIPHTAKLHHFMSAARKLAGYKL